LALCLQAGGLIADGRLGPPVCVVFEGWGGMAVLDRSWYGRVLVERVEGVATNSEW
jgi:hypothetical protein